MIGVGQQNLNAQVFGQVALRQPLDRSLRSHGHEHRSFDGSVSGVEQAGARPCAGALGDYFKRDLRQPSIVTVDSICATDAYATGARARPPRPPGCALWPIELSV